MSALFEAASSGSGHRQAAPRIALEPTARTAHDDGRCAHKQEETMDPIVGRGKYSYRVNEEWQRVPEWLELKPGALSVDSEDRVYCFNRNDAHPVVIFDRDGNFVASWGEGLFRFPHAIRIVQEQGRDVVWLCDEHLQQFYKFTTDGKLLQTIGEKG